MSVLEEMLIRCARKRLKQLIIRDQILVKFKNLDNINERLKKAYIYAIQLEYEMKIGKI